MKLGWDKIWLLLPMVTASVCPAESPEESFAAAAEAFAAGQYQAAIEGFEAAAEGYREAGDPAGRATALANLSIVFHAAGNYPLAFQKLALAMDLAKEADDPGLTGQLRGIMGSISTFSRKGEEAEKNLAEALDHAREHGPPSDLVVMLHDWGVLWAGRGDPFEAVAAFEEALQLCDEHGLGALKAKTLTNQAMLFLNLAIEQHELMKIAIDEAGQADRRRDFEDFLQLTLESLGNAENELKAIESDFELALVATTLGDCYRAALETGAVNSGRASQRALANYQTGLRAAKESGNPLAMTFALSSTARLYERHERFDEALSMTRQARVLAQQISSPDYLFETSWQAGRLLAKLDQRDDALKAYAAAREALAGIGHDIAIGYGNRNLGQSFRQAVGAFYFEHAELVLDDPSEPNLIAARDIVESLKSAELEDYFQDECINIARSKIRDIGKVDDRSAVVYTIPMSKGTALLITIGETLHYRHSETLGDEVERQARLLRELVATPTTGQDYLKPAQALHEALIRPIESLLAENKIEHLVFVPDGALRSVPMAVLHDGERHLGEKYALAISPGLTLMEPRQLPAGSRLLVGALSEASQGFGALPYVELEVEKLRAIAESEFLVNEDFVKENFAREVSEGDFRIVHVASHAVFEPQSGSSYILMHGEGEDGRLSLTELEAIIRPKEFDNLPVEMLCLSACNTATGDDRAALGLAGVAVKSGARSALATLWEVDDQITSELMERFYRNLLDGANSRAVALQQAQISVRAANPEKTHPYYWAPFMIIGNWL